MLYINAKIYTMESAGVIERGFLQTRGGKIAAVGPMEALNSIVSGSKDAPLDEEKTVDCSGLLMFPGFIDGHTHLGMWGDAMGFEGDDGNEETDPVTPHLRALDSVNPMDRCFTEAWQAGVTTVVTGPGSANAIGGQMLAMKTYGRQVDRMVIAAPLAIKMALGENPKTVYHDKNQAPNTRMATVSVIRESLFKAKRYLEDKRKAEESPEEYDPPEWDMKCESLLPLLEGKMKAHIHCHRADDIFTAVRLAREFGFGYVLVHATEGGMIAEELAGEGAPVFSGPYLCDRCKPELKNLSPATPGVLAAAGVPTSLVTDHPELPVQYLPLCAGLAVREGMAWEDALRAITIHPAAACGLDSRVGSLRPGKDADFVLFAENPLSLTARPVMVVLEGRRIL